MMTRLPLGALGAAVTLLAACQEPLIHDDSKLGAGESSTDLRAVRSLELGDPHHGGQADELQLASVAVGLHAGLLSTQVCRSAMADI